MNKTFLRLMALLLSLFALLPLVSCGQEPTKPETTPETLSEETTPPEDYTFPELDCKGENFTFLSATTDWGFYTDLDFDSMTGEALDNAVFERNRAVEDRFKVKLKFEYENINEVTNKYYNEAFSGTDTYQVGLMPANKMAPLITDGLLYNLCEFDTLHLEEDYWDQNVYEQSKIGTGDKVFFAASDFSLFGFDGTLCVLYNADMFESLGFEKPYDLVRSGNWTLDEMSRYMRDAKNLNGDDKWTWNKDNNCIYGMVSWNAVVDACIFGAGMTYIDKDENNQPYLAIENDRFYDVTSKIYSILSQPGDFLSINKGGENSYGAAFKAGRGALITCELIATGGYRDMEASIGLIPIPKYDAAQQNYYSYRTTYVLLTSIPHSNNDPERAAILLDALSYLSQKMVLPVYYENRLQQKQLKANPDDIEMLDKYIASNRVFDIGCVYGWTNDLFPALEQALTTGNGDAASTVAMFKSKIESAIENTLEQMKKD